MTDRPESTRKPTWAFDGDHGIRATYGYQLQPREARLLNEVLGALIELARESGFIYPSKEPIVVQDLRAVARDLRHGASYLFGICKNADDSMMIRSDFRLSDFAGTMAPQVAAIAAQIEAAIAPVAADARPDLR